MSAATCDQEVGTSASFISKTTEPSGLVMRESRVPQVTESSGSSPGLVKSRVMRSPVAFPSRSSRTGPRLPVCALPTIYCGGDDYPPQNIVRETQV